MSRRKPATLFTRIYALMVISALFALTAISAILLTNLANRNEGGIQSAIEDFYGKNTAVLGNPPSYDQALELADRLGIEIAYFNGARQVVWSTDEDPSLNEGLLDRIGEDDSPTGYYRRRLYYYTDVSGGTVLYYGNLLLNSNKLLITAISVLLIAMFSYILTMLFLRRLLQPLRVIDEGVAELSRGNLGHSLPIPRQPEFARLAEALNGMSSRISAMIQDKEQLLLDVSHELKSPLTRMKLALEFLESDEITRSLADDVRIMEAMVSRILTSARMDSSYGAPKRENCSLSELGDEVLRTIGEKEPGYIFHAASDLRIDGDPELVKTALKNIVENALNYSRSANRPVEISTTRDEALVRVSVRDYGVGIPEEDIPRVTEPFFRVDRSRNEDTGGTGLGLYLTRRIIEAHGGELRILSPDGPGCIVEFTLPAA